MMKSSLVFVSLVLSSVMLMSHQVLASELSAKDNKKVIESASKVVSAIFQASNDLRHLEGLEHYSEDPDAFYVSDGIIHSLDELRVSYQNVGSSVERIHNKILRWNTKVLSKELVSFTLPVELTLKLKNLPEYKGQIIWTATLRKNKDRWLVVQSHESWTGCAEVAKALSSPSH